MQRKAKKRKSPEKVVIRLKLAQKQFLTDFLNKGQGKARLFKRAKVLLRLNEGISTSVIAKEVGYLSLAIRQIGKRFLTGGIESALYEKTRKGKPRLLSENQSNKIIAMVCSDPPEGYSRWSVKLIAQEARERKMVPKVGRETIRILLKTHDLKPWREKNVVRWQD